MLIIFSRSYYYTVWSAIGIILSSVCPSVRLWRCALWLSGLVYRAKSCTSMFPAGMFLFVPSDTFAVGCKKLRSVTCRMGSHSVIFHPTQANTPRLYPSQTGWYSIYQPFKDGGLSKPRPIVYPANTPQKNEREFVMTTCVLVYSDYLLCI